VADQPLAHSARLPGGEPQTYADHIQGVVKGARLRVNLMIAHHRDSATMAKLANAVIDAATFHDLGKLDPDVQKALRRGRDAKLGWDHIDAGVAHLRASGAYMAAWLAPITRRDCRPGHSISPIGATESCVAAEMMRTIPFAIRSRSSGQIAI
jgi:hypothetical protein